MKKLNYKEGETPNIDVLFDVLMDTLGENGILRYGKFLDFLNESGMLDHLGCSANENSAAS